MISILGLLIYDQKTFNISGRPIFQQEVYLKIILLSLFLSFSLSLSLHLSIYLSISLNRSFASHLIITGAIRFLVSCGTWVAAGNVNGVINIIDIRSGELLYHWKPADKWPLPVSILTVV